VSVPYSEYEKETPLDNAKEKEVVFTREAKSEATRNKSLPVISDGPFPLKERERDNEEGVIPLTSK
jgi:hypothetical protein